jgi:hypothetical protein
MNKDELTSCALANGWRMIASCPSLTKFTFGLSHKTVLR